MPKNQPLVSARVPDAPSSATEDPNRSTNSTVTSRVTALLDLVGRHEGGIGAREAERATGIDRSAVSRIFRQLESLGWVEQIDDGGTYTVGPEMFAIAAAVRQRDSAWRAARPLLRSLTDRFDETTYLAARRDHQVVFQEKVDCTQRIRYVVELNNPFPLTTGGAGRAILSALPRDESEQIISEGLTQYTPTSITDPEKYRVQLEKDRQLGYAYSRSGWVARGGGVASPFFDASGTCVGAIALSAPIDRLGAEVVRTVGPAVREAAHQLSKRLGYSGELWGKSAG